MDKNDLNANLSKVKDLATEAAIKSLIPQEKKPKKPDEKTPIRRWLESNSDCA